MIKNASDALGNYFESFVEKKSLRRDIKTL